MKEPARVVTDQRGDPEAHEVQAVESVPQVPEEGGSHHVNLGEMVIYRTYLQRNCISFAIKDATNREV